jgi:hypothetical protein
MAKFIFTSKIMERVAKIGINSELEIDPNSMGVQEDDVKKYGYFLLFILNLPFYAGENWKKKCASPMMKEKNRKRKVYF